MQYTTADYREAIERELSKRRTTYPRIVDKKQKQWKDQGEDVLANTIELTTTQRIQFELLSYCNLIIEYDTNLSDNIQVEIFRELQRELRMRKGLYPRWVGWGRMTAESASLETSVWESLTKYFHETYCPDAPWRKPPTRKAKSHG